MKASRVSELALGASELTGICALYLTPDVPKAFLAVPFAGLLLFGLRLRLGSRAMLLMVGGAVLSAIALAYWGENPLSFTLSGGLLFVHGILWLSKRPEVYRYWRFGIAFFELTLAAILAPETHMFLLIFAFALLASLSLSFGFLERKFAESGTEAVVSRSFAGAITVLTFLIFLSSLLIFPILPRSHWSGFGKDWSEVGYAETIDFQSALKWGAGSSRPLVWLFRPEGASWTEILPGGLLRGAVLDRFNGIEWSSGARQVERKMESSTGTKAQIYREPMAANVLPVPYGTSMVEMGTRERTHLSNGEWPAPALRGRRAQYEVQVNKGMVQDPPKAVQSEMPDAALFPSILQAARRIGARARSDSERIAAVTNYFRDFKGALAPMAAYAPGKPHPVETFFHTTHEGHCELFATSAALLFRALGMPARLVVGFRSFPSASSSLHVFRSTDAHVWVEAWEKGRGWKVVDPSPVVAVSGGWELPDLYEYVNAYWHRYIVGYEFDFRGIEHGFRKAAPYLALICLLIFLAQALRPLLSWEPRPPRHRISRAWKKTELTLQEKASDFFATPEGDLLKRHYMTLRFGPSLPGPEACRDFAREALRQAREFVSR